MSPELQVTLWAAWLFVFGACVGSFLNVCIYRLPAGLSIVWPPSHCPRCLKRIAWYDNLPVLSYFLLRGRCRHCREQFSAQYAMIEALTGLVFAGLYLAYFVFLVRGTGFARWDVYAVHVVLASALIVCAVIDFKYKEVYDVVTYGGMALGVVLSAFFPAIQSQSHAPQWFAAAWLNAGVSSLVGLVVGAGLIGLTGLVASAVMRVLECEDCGYRMRGSLLRRRPRICPKCGSAKLGRRGAMGFGDVLLMGMIGAVLGWEGAVLTFFIAPVFGLVCLSRMFRQRYAEVPFGPFLALGAGAVMLAQRAIVGYYGPRLAVIWEAVRGG